MPSNRLYSLSELLEKGVFQESTSEFIPVRSVFVPMIQRPYAQGRRSEAETEIRRNFIKKIFECLTGDDKVMELNFVYGSLDDSRFELLDGQQRLTTLFLLSWYLAMRGDNPSEDTAGLSKFSYQTRTTSSLFIKKLLSNPVSLTSEPSRLIRSMPWYTNAFSKDSTVTGMLTMLDEIHTQYSNTPSDTRPTHERLERLRFYLLDLTNFGLTDELFIKMNARGLQLTPFENFKAELTGWIRSNPFGDGRYEENIDADGRSMPYWLYFSSRTDGRWTDIFWKMPEGDPNPDNLGAEESDRRFFTFVKRWLTNRALAITDTSQQAADTKFFDYFNGRSPYNHYYSFDKTEEFLRDAQTHGIDLIKELAKTLRFLSDDTLSGTLFDAMTPPWGESPQMPWDEKFEMRPMIIFSAISEFILSQPDDPRRFDTEEFRRWMRVVHNVVQNRDINRVLLQIVLTRQLKTALKFNTSPIYPRFRSYVESLGGQSNREFNAEKLKIELIEKDAGWEDAFIEAEKNPFMTGAVTFYLDDQPDMTSYRRRTSRVPLLFDVDGVSPAFRADNSLLRAIMARSYDYSSFRMSGYNISLSNRNAADRFLKNLTVWNSDSECRRLMRELLDCDDTAQMLTKVAAVSQERHSLKHPARFSGDNDLMRKGFDTLHSAGPKNPLGWLESTGEKAMRIWFADDGRMSLYKGYVNCMYLNSGREEFIPAFVEAATARGFSAEYSDNRQLDAYNSFGLYSGQSITLDLTADGHTYAIWFGHDFKAEVYDVDPAGADALSYCAEPEFQRDLALDDNGELKTWGHNRQLFHRAIFIPDIRNVNPEDLASLLILNHETETEEA